MTIPFEKYHGTGNDFVVIDNRSGALSDQDKPLFIKMCDRHFGIGSDGLMLIQHSSDADFEMVFYNPDGSKSLCGNGSRCAIKFAHRAGMVHSKGTMLTTDGIHAFEVFENGNVSVSMGDVDQFEKIEGHWFINTGSPHLILIADNVDNTDVVTIGRKWRYNEHFAPMNGSNVNFTEPSGEAATFKVRTYERGVENETLSCGTGVTAVALAMALEQKASDSAHIETKGGDLTIKFSKDETGFKNIWLQGPAEKIFSGEFHA